MKGTLCMYCGADLGEVKVYTREEVILTYQWSYNEKKQMLRSEGYDTPDDGKYSEVLSVNCCNCGEELLSWFDDDEIKKLLTGGDTGEAK